jgi:hypothetical protein
VLLAEPAAGGSRVTQNQCLLTAQVGVSVLSLPAIGGTDGSPPACGRVVVGPAGGQGKPKHDETSRYVKPFRWATSNKAESEHISDTRLFAPVIHGLVLFPSASTSRVLLSPLVDLSNVVF